jgi:uncharacterized repeat protein (TIGR03803 family)
MRRPLPLPVVSFLFIVVTAFAVHAQNPSLHQLFAFACTSTSCPDGKEPDALIVASDGNLYGVAEYSNTATGVAGGGTIFKMTPGGQITVLYAFPENQTTGFFPNGYAPDAIAEGSDGMLYGAASIGGSTSASAGTLWRISKTGTGFQVLVRYCTSCTSGGFPNSIVAGTDGNLYGTTGYGGTFPSSGICESLGCGVVFKLTTAGVYTVLHAFNGTSETSEPVGVIQASDGNLYGATAGNLSEGSVFKVTPSGQFSTLHLFGSGTYALAGVTQASDGLLYGFSHVVSAPAVELFNITTGGSFQNLAQIAQPLFKQFGLAQPIQASDGNLWTAAAEGGSGNWGRVLAVTTKGAIVESLSFNSKNGSFATGKLVQLANGTIYGTTIKGGTTSTGTVASGVIYTVTGLPAR